MKPISVLMTACLGWSTSLGASAWADPPAPTPLAEVLSAARKFELGLALSDQQVAIARAARDTQEGGLWPRLEARLSYTRNQHDAVVSLPGGEGAEARTVTITPFDQLEAQATLTVPILDLGLRARIGASELRVEGLAAQRDSAATALDERVATAYFQIAFAQSRKDIAASEVELVSLRLRELAVRQAAGFENRLVIETAQADLERARREVSAAEYDLASARLDLEMMSGKPAVVATLGGLNVGGAAMSLEAALERVASLPAVRAAEAEARAYRREADAARLDLVPTVEAFVSDRLTNAAGFGEANNISAGISARFALDAPTFGRRDEALARARAAELTAMVARRDAETRLRRLDLERTQREAAVTAASAEVTAREAALRDAEVRAKGGLATTLELRTAERDRQAAWLELARAQAELALTRALFIIAAGGTP